MSGMSPFIPVIKVADILYQPMSYKTKKSDKRLSMLSDIANENNVDVDRYYYHFAKFLAEYIRGEIQKSISSQTVSGKSMKKVYKPLSKKYVKTKPWGTKGKFWINTGQLYNTISVYQYRGQLYVGFPTRVKHNKTNINMSKVLMYLEHGTKNQPARPLLRPILGNVSKHIDTLFANFIKGIRK